MFNWTIHGNRKILTFLHSFSCEPNQHDDGERLQKPASASLPSTSKETWRLVITLLLNICEKLNWFCRSNPVKTFLFGFLYKLVNVCCGHERCPVGRMASKGDSSSAPVHCGTAGGAGGISEHVATTILSIWQTKGLKFGPNCKQMYHANNQEQNWETYQNYRY